MKCSRIDIVTFLVTVTGLLLLFWGIDLILHKSPDVFVRVAAALLAVSVGLGVVWGRWKRRKESSDKSARNWQ